MAEGESSGMGGTWMGQGGFERASNEGSLLNRICLGWYHTLYLHAISA
jgi:hypothetical protein